jgi:signal transduction histidine kinase
VIGEALVVAAAGLAAGVVGALGVRRLPTVRLQLTGLAVLCAIVPLVAVVAIGALMVDHGQALTLTVVAVGSGLAVLGGGLLVAGGLADRIERLRRAPEAISAGDLSARAPRGGPAELDAMAAALNDMAERLEELLDARRRMAMWAGHDLRGPLASLRAMTEALEDGLADPADYLPAMGERIGDLSRLVDDLFELARLDAGAQLPETRPAPVAALVEAAIRARAAEAEARGVRLEPRLPGDLPPVECAPDSVRRVLDNLLGNAIRHTRGPGTVSVGATRADGDVRLEVQDTGEGLSAEAAERMFEHFWRGDGARAADGGGAGLGLAIARGLVEAQGGVIWAEHAEGGGARICFTLPVAGSAGA